MVASYRLPSHPTKDRRATDSSFALAGGSSVWHTDCKCLINDCFYIHHKHLWFQQKQQRGSDSQRDLSIVEKEVVACNKPLQRQVC